MPKPLDPTGLSGAFARGKTKTSLDHLVPAKGEPAPAGEAAPAAKKAKKTAAKKKSTRRRKPALQVLPPAAAPAEEARADRVFGWREPWVPGTPGLAPRDGWWERARDRRDALVGAAIRRVLRAAA